MRRRINIGFFYVSLFIGGRRFNGRQLYGFVYVKDKPINYWLFMWGKFNKRIGRNA